MGLEAATSGRKLLRSREAKKLGRVDASEFTGQGEVEAGEAQARLHETVRVVPPPSPRHLDPDRMPRPGGGRTPRIGAGGMRVNVTEAGAVLTLVNSESPPSVDSPLLERLRRGDPDAIGRLYDQHNQAVRAFARRMVGDDATAEDLLHEVFVCLPGAVRRFQGASSVRTFLISIAINHVRHHVRAAARRRAAMDRLAFEPPAASPDPERQLSQAALARALHRALDDLPSDQRVAFVLCEIEERTSREAAEITGAPEATIRTRLHHARLKLRASLEKAGLR